MFKIHPTLEKDLKYLGKLELSQIRLMPNDSNPWVVLIPEVNDIKEIYQLSSIEQSTLLKEVTTISKILHKSFKADKMNIAAFGNMVEQFHIHIVARFKDDPFWPGSIIGQKIGRNEKKEFVFENRLKEAYLSMF